MKVLQVACGFSYSTVYEKMFSQLMEYAIPFEVYVPQHKDKSVSDIEDSQYPYHMYSNKIIEKYDKILYYSKIKRMVKDIENNFNLEEVTTIHAHSLFSDGAVAYQIYKKYRIPYIVAVRNTDVNKYFKYAKHLKTYALNILRNAKKIIFISPSYKKYVIDTYISPIYKNEIANKAEVIPNGVDDFWLKESCNIKKDKNNDKVNLIFVGRIDKNKNVSAIIQAIKILEEREIETNLEIIGDGPLYKTIEEQTIDLDNVTLLGPIYDKKKLQKYYLKNNILIVPSFNETFGLVYIEALSCGLPVIYAKGQGLDGYFKNGEVGYAINPYKPEEISDSIQLIMEKYENISNTCYESIDQFKWSRIVEIYIAIYKEISK